MFGWLKRLFSSKEKETGVDKDMRVTPVDNPLDYREDGSIRPGDPAWAMMMETLQSGEPFISNQRADGTWDVRPLRK